MTPEEKNRLYALRKAGRSYTEIADEMGISKNTVKTYCRRTGLTPADEIGADAQVPKHTADKFCLYCGKPVVQIPVHRAIITGRQGHNSRTVRAIIGGQQTPCNL